MNDEVNYFVAVTPFVVVPADQFHKVTVEGDTCGSVEHGSTGFVNEVGADYGVFGITGMPFI